MGILLSYGVELPVIDTKSKRSVLLFNKYYRAGAKLEGMLVMHCMTNAVLEYQFYL